MQKILLLFLIITVLSSCELNKKNVSETLETKINITSTGSIEKKEELSKEEIRKQKVELIRKKLALRGLIRKGDISLKEKEYTTALLNFIKLHKEIPKDKSIIEKLGDTYFKLKKYKKAYFYYSKIKNYEKLDKNKVANTLLFSKPINKENIEYFNTELSSLHLTKDELFYFTNSITCSLDFSLCRKNFQEYFKKEKIEEKIKERILKENAEKINKKIELKDTKDSHLENIKLAFEAYKNFQIEDLSYKGALISKAFFENELYPVSIATSKDILKEKKDYKPLLKLVAKNYYELGDYINSKLYLIEYNKLVEEDPEASYFLGVVYEKLHEYILSTIHLNKALKTGYKNSLEIRRRILFDYYELGETEKMLGIFNDMLENNESELELNDFNTAIYYQIINSKLTQAKKFTQIAIKKFPESELFDGYYGWILLEETNNFSSTTSKEKLEKGYTKAEEYIDEGLKINSKNPMLNLVKGKILLKKQENRKAFIYFKKTLSLDNSGDFGILAQKQLDLLKK